MGQGIDISPKMIVKHMKICSALLIIREIQIKTIQMSIHRRRDEENVECIFTGVLFGRKWMDLDDRFYTMYFLKQFFNYCLKC